MEDQGIIDLFFERSEQAITETDKKYAMDADLILYVVDASGNIDEDDQNIISLLDGKKAIILLNKSDLENKITEESLKENLAKRLKHSEDIRILRTSTIDPSSENSGMEELEETIRNMFFEGELKHNNELVITSMVSLYRNFYIAGCYRFNKLNIVEFPSYLQPL